MSGAVVFHVQDIAQNPLIPECFKHVVEGGDLSETATDIVVELLRMCAPDISVYQPVIQVWRTGECCGETWSYDLFITHN